MVKITVYSNNPPGKGWNRLLGLAGAVKDAYSPDVEVEVIYKGDLPDMPGPPDIAVEGRLLGKYIAAEKLEEIIMELIPEWFVDTITPIRRGMYAFLWLVEVGVNWLWCALIGHPLRERVGRPESTPFI